MLRHGVVKFEYGQAVLVIGRNTNGSRQPSLRCSGSLQAVQKRVVALTGYRSRVSILVLQGASPLTISISQRTLSLVGVKRSLSVAW